MLQLKASNAEQRYLSGLSDKIRAVEKQSITAELETALFVSSAGMVLKLGIASVALTGSVLLVQGSIDVLTLFLFLMAASRMYDPMREPARVDLLRGIQQVCGGLAAEAESTLAVFR